MPDNAYRPDIVTRMLITRVELITISLVIIRSIWHKSTADFFLRFGKFPPQICESCGATYRRNYETFCAKHVQSSNSRRKQRPNPCIIGNAVLLKLVNN